MAEYVNLRTEDMISELEKMVHSRLFDKSEVKTIAKKRKEFEYKIQRRTKCKDDFLRYIQYEMDLLKLIRKRRERLTGHNTYQVEYQAGQRVHSLFKSAVGRFQSDVRIWLSYFKYCKQMRFNASIGRSLTDMLKIHSNKPDLWAFAASWEFEENKSVENARQYILRGLRIHHLSKELYMAGIEMELRYADQMRKERRARLEAEGGRNAVHPSCSSTSSQNVTREGAQSQTAAAVSDQVLEGRLAEMLFESAAKKIHDVKFIIELLSIAKKFDFTSHLQSKIVDFMIVRYNNEELTWDTMARRELEGLPYASSVLLQVENNTARTGTETGVAIEETSMIPGNSSLKERIRLCIQVYLLILKQLPTERMFSYYLEMVIELNQDQTHLPIYKRNLLRYAFQAAHSAGKMQEKYYLIWVEMLKASGKMKKLENVVRIATDRFPSSLELWQVRLLIYVARDDEINCRLVFADACAKLGTVTEECLVLWKLMLQYYQTKDMHRVQAHFKEAILQAPVISRVLKPLYVEWCLLTKGIFAARKLYDVISVQPHLCVEIHTRMAALEAMQPAVRLKRIRKCHELACLQFGKHNTDVWMEYVKFELKMGDPKKVGDIYMRAVKNLDSALTDCFTSEFSMSKTGMAIPMEH